MASQAQLDLIVNLKDQATSGLRGIGSALGGVARDAASFAVGGLLQSGIQQLGNVARGAFSTMMGEAQEARAGMAQLEAVIASTGGAAGLTAQEVLDLSSKLSAANGLSTFADDAVLAGNNLLLTFTNIGRDVFPMASQAAVDMATALGGDPVSKAQMLGKALNDPIAGISALGRAGVQFSEDQKAAIASMVETGDVAGAQTLILEELNKQFGGQAEAAAAAAGPMLQFREQMNGLAESLGTAIIPKINEFVGALTRPEIIAAITDVATMIVDVLGRGLEWLATNILPQIGPAVQFIRDAFVTFQEALAGDWVDSGAVQPFHRVIGVLGQVVAALTGEGGLAGAWAIVLPYVTEAIEGIQAYIVEQLPVWQANLAAWGSAAWSWVTETAIPLLGAKMGELLAAIGTWVVETGAPGLVEFVKTFGPPFLNWIATEVIPTIGEKLGELLTNISNWVTQTAVPDLKKFVEAFGPPFLDWIEDEVIPNLAAKLEALLTEIGAWITNNATRFADAALAIGKSIIDGIVRGLLNFGATIGQTIQGLIPGNVSAPSVTAPSANDPNTRGSGSFNLFANSMGMDFARAPGGGNKGGDGRDWPSGGNKDQGRGWPGSGDKSGGRDWPGGQKGDAERTIYLEQGSIVVQIFNASQQAAYNGVLAAFREAGLVVVG